MDASHFDALAKHLSLPGTRRRLLGALAALPLAGGALDILAPDEVDAHGRRKRRKKRHKHGKGRRRTHRKKRNSGTPPPPGCIPEAVSQTCAGTCGSVLNNCQQAVECDPCCTLTPADDLQEAITNAADGATLRLCAGTWVVPASLDIAKPLTLIGEGADQTILDGNDERRVLQITANNVKVTLQALTITHGADGFGGGGIYTAGNLTLIDAAIVANHHTGTNSDGGGGGILNYGPLTVRNTRITGNTAKNGGGIDNDSGTMTLESGSIITGNTAGFGGGIFIYKGTVTLENGSIIQLNTASSEGGGIYIDKVEGTVTADSGSQVAGNTADFGGGIFTYNGTVTLESGSIVNGNTASDDGGGIYNHSGTLTVNMGALICGNIGAGSQCSGAISGTGTCPNPADGICPPELT